MNLISLVDGSLVLFCQPLQELFLPEFVTFDRNTASQREQVEIPRPNFARDSLMRVFLQVLAYIILFLGLFSMLTPLPGGTLFIVSGFTLLICTSERAEHWIKKTRSKNPWFNRPIMWLEDKVGEKLSRPIRRTRPDFDLSDYR